MTKAFISYSRKDTTFARKLADALLEQKYELWVDWDSIPPTVDWKLHIQKGVEESDVFLFLISPDSLSSHECREEINQAVKNGKRMIPLVVREIDSALAPKEISHINWIFFDKKGLFETSFKKLLEAINTDYEWVLTHRRIQTKALEWDRAKREKSFLLRGKDLEDAEAQMVVNASKEPKPTNLQREYMLKSKTAAANQRRLITSVSIGAAIAMLILAVFALIARQDAVENEQIANDAKALAQINAEIADSKAKLAAEKEQEANQNALIAQIGEISSLSLGKLNQDYNESLLYSVEAYKRANKNGFNLERAKSSLLTTLQNQPGLLRVIPAHGDWVNSIVFSRDGTIMASASYEGTSYLWNIADASNPVRLYRFDGDDIAISSNKKLFATSWHDAEFTPVILLWDITDITKPRQVSEFDGNFIIDFMPDNRHLVIQHSAEDEEDYYIRIWDISVPANPRRVSEIVGTGAALTPDGKLLAVSHTDADDNTKVTLWDVTNPGAPVERSTIDGNFEARRNDFELRPIFSFNTDGTMLAIAGYDDSDNSVVEIWNVSDPSTPAKLSTATGASDWVNSLAFDPDGNQLVLGSNIGKIALWDMSDPSLPRWSPSSETLTGHPLAVNYMAFTPSGQILATGSYDGTIMLWNMTALQNPLQVQAPLGEMLAFNSRGDRLVSANHDEQSGTNSTVIWDASDSSAITQITEINTASTDAAISPDNKFLVTSLYDEESGIGSTTLWNISDPANPVEHALLDIDGYDMMFSPNSQVLSVTTYDPTSDTSETTLWDLSDSTKPIQFGTIEDELAWAKFNSDGTLLATSDWTNEEIELWDVSTPGSFKKLGTMEGGNITFSPDNHTIAILIRGDEMQVDVWDFPNWTDRKKIGTLQGSNNATFSPDGKLLATTKNEETESHFTILLWDASNPIEPLGGPIEGHSREIRRLAFSPDGKILASASYDKTVRLWNISDPTQPIPGTILSGHSDWIYTLAFNEDGSLIASGSEDHNVILWQVKAYNDAEPIGELRGGIFDAITAVAFASPSRLVANDRKLWDIDPSSWIEKACNMAGSNFSLEKWKLLFPDEKYEPTCPNIIPEALTEVEEGIVQVNVSGGGTLPACSEPSEPAASCSLLQISPRDQFCVGKASYSLYAIPAGSTLTPVNDDFKCKSEGVYGGEELFSCTGPKMNTFDAQLCNMECTVTQSNQCDDGFGLDPSGSCCMPVVSEANACITVTLEVKDCTALK